MLLTETELRKDLYQRNMTQVEVAEKHGCSRMTVRRRMDEYGFESLPRLCVQEKQDGRIYYSSGGEGFYVYRLVAIAHGADPHDIFGGAQVHHINECIHDNRPENLAVLTPQEHAVIHQSDFTINKKKGVMEKGLELEN